MKPNDGYMGASKRNIHLQLQMDQKSKYEVVELFIHEEFIELAHVFDYVLSVAILVDHLLLDLITSLNLLQIVLVANLLVMPDPVIA